MTIELKEISKKELTNGYDHFLTVGGLKKFLNKHNLPDTAKVVVQRVEDVYYEKHNWGVQTVNKNLNKS